MQSIHGHEVLQMMIASGEAYSVASLEAAIVARFGDEARFHTCSGENLTAGELVRFLQNKG
ncbi:putative metal-binding protein [Raoultella terrigena]|uniref:Putative metal-binding protein n=2 Tax=Raoultella terrigena TaxID=577 RepID=A0A4U9CZ00_RAOTE|nr:putative metal-binding protein [Raoultella terrigena]